MKTKLTKSESIKKIDRAFYNLKYACEHTYNWNRYIELIEQEEKGHRRFCPDGLSCGLTKAQSVRLFAVKTVFSRFVPEHAEDGNTIFTPEAKDYFTVKGSVFGACAIADSCKAEILKAFSLPEMSDWLETVDYVELNKDPKQLEVV